MPNAVLNSAKVKKVLAALEGNWQAEMEGYHTYLALADRETDPIRAQVLRHLAAAELEHAALWAERISELGGPEPVYNGNPAGEADSLASRAGGPMMALRRLEIEESRHIANYGTQLKELGDEGSVAILEHVIEDEKEHYRELGSLLRGHYIRAGGRADRRPQSRARRDAGQAQPGPQAAGRVDRRRHLRRQRRPRRHLRHRLRRVRRNRRRQQIRAAGRAFRHDRQRALHGLRRVSRRQERARNLRGRDCTRARSHPDERPRGARAALALLPGQGPARARRRPRGRPHLAATPSRCSALSASSGSARRATR